MPSGKLLVIGALCMTLVSGCRTYRCVYMISRYDGSYARTLPANVHEIEYQTRSGRQVAFYVAPRLDPQRPPDRLWMLFGGNASLALGWLDLVHSAPDPHAGYLLLDYPGFGLCQGQPNQESILESAEKALATLSGRLGVAADYFEGRLNLLGHSLGCATALLVAPRHQVRRVVLLAPFTTMVEITRHLVGWPLCQFVPDRFDNGARLEELYRMHPRPAVAIVHGERDRIVPVAMGRRLARLYPNWIRYHELPEADHQSLVTAEERAVNELIFQSDEPYTAARIP